jgi:hypothetical protein
MSTFFQQDGVHPNPPKALSKQKFLEVPGIGTRQKWPARRMCHTEPLPLENLFRLSDLERQSIG